MDPIQAYFELAEKQPALFAPSGRVPLVLEEARLRAYTRRTGRQVGLVYDNFPYYYFLADLCGEPGREFVYCRIVYPHPESNGVVIIPRRGGRYALLSIFRHCPRQESGGEFPRGFAEDLSPADNARKEVREELGAELLNLEYLGEVQPDTGVSAGRVQVFAGEVGETHLTGTEGIHGLRWVTEEELQAQIADGTITDGLTLAAYAKLLCSRAR